MTTTARNPYLRFRLTLGMKNQLRGGVPKDTEVIKAWLEARLQDTHPADAIYQETLASMAPVVAEDVATEKAGDAVWNGFKRNQEGFLFIEGRQVKAMIKESASILRGVAPLTIAGLKAKIAETFFVEEDQICLLKGGEPVREADGSEESFVHAMTAMGPINALKRTEYVEGAVVCCTVRILNRPLVNKEKQRLEASVVLEHILEHAQWSGLGAERSQGHGQFTYVIEPLD